MQPLQRLSAFALTAGFCCLYAQSSPAVLTYHNNALRTGHTTAETKLTWSNVAPTSFRKLFTYPLDGYVYAQPLYVPAVNIGGVRNVVYAATENNSVYALDADRPTAGGVLWHVNFNSGPDGTVVTPVPSEDVNCNDLTPQVGITGTPVIDITSATLYVVAKTKEVSPSGVNYVQRLHALSLVTGEEKFGGPMTITASVPGICGKTDGHGNVVFGAQRQNQRAGLLLANGVVYITWASHCDYWPYNGWVIGYDARTLQQVSVFNTTPELTDNNCRGGIWQSGGAPSWDGKSLYVVTGNGGFSGDQAGGRSYGNSVLKLTPDPVTKALQVADYFTPYYWSTLNLYDFDLGSTAPVLIPNVSGPNPNLVIAGGKNTTLYLLNGDNLGGFTTGMDNIIQELHNSVGTYGEPFPTPAVFRNRIYFGGGLDHAKMFYLNNGRLTNKPVAKSGNAFGESGAGLSVSADPLGNNAILWALDAGAQGILRAFRGDTLAELYNTNAAGARDQFGEGVKFSVPTVANGKVFVGTANSLVVFGNY